MKKDITYITLPSDLIQWISQKVQTVWSLLPRLELLYFPALQCFH